MTDDGSDGESRPKRGRDDKGRLAGPSFGDQEFTDAVSRLDLPTTGDVARDVGCSRSTAYDRLSELQADGAIDSRQVGNALVWTIVD